MSIRFPLFAFTLLTLASPAQSQDAKPSKDEQALVDLINKVRDKDKLPPFKIDATLTKAARGHSANMAKTGIHNHVIDGKNMNDRLDDLKYQYQAAAENIAIDATSPAEAIEAWLASKAGHREVILSKEFEEIGVGFSRNPKGEADEWLITLVAAKPLKK